MITGNYCCCIFYHSLHPKVHPSKVATNGKVVGRGRQMWRPWRLTWWCPWGFKHCHWLGRSEVDMCEVFASAKQDYYILCTYIYIELLMPSSSITNHHHHQHQHHVENHFIILSENPPQCHDQSTTTTSTCHPAVHSEVATPEWFQAETQQHKRSRSNSMSPGSFTELVTVTSAKESEAISSSGNGNETHLVLHELHPTVFALDTKCTKMLLPPPYASLSDY